MLSYTLSSISCNTLVSIINEYLMVNRSKQEDIPGEGNYTSKSMKGRNDPSISRTQMKEHSPAGKKEQTLENLENEE